MSQEFGRSACSEFNAAIKQCYMDEFLHLPTAAGIKSIVKLHKSQQKFDGMFAGKIVQRLGMEHLKGKKITHQLFWRQFATTILFFDMLPMYTWEH